MIQVHRNGIGAKHKVGGKVTCCSLNLGYFVTKVDHLCHDLRIL
jgi:hypothetical protein